jgi:hypothetical protein
MLIHNCFVHSFLYPPISEYNVPIIKDQLTEGINIVLFQVNETGKYYLLKF